MHQEKLLLPLYRKLIADMRSGRRLKPDGTAIRKQTICNYEFALKHLEDFELRTQPLRIIIAGGKSRKLFIAEQNYWRRFYVGFTNFLYKEKKCKDNYVGLVIKCIKAFFRYLKESKGLQLGDHYREFYACKDEVPVISLLPEQLRLLISNKEFDNKLSPSLKIAKDIFVVGCTVGLRVSDLFKLCPTDIEHTQTGKYLNVLTVKTGAAVKIKLPDYVFTILTDYINTRNKRKYIFPQISLKRFNDRIKRMGEIAGWTQEVGKFRRQKGKLLELHLNDRRYRFCDLMSSHIMRRTAITTLLMMGVKEHVVKKLSGHAADSKSFYRYVNLAQAYLDKETEQAFAKLIA